jgi:hypothetical protein
LYLGQFAAEIVDKSVIEASTNSYWLLTDEFETLVKGIENFVGNENPCFQRFPYVCVLHILGKFLHELSSLLGPLPQVAQHVHKQLPWILNWHDYSPCVLLFGWSALSDAVVVLR